MKMTSTPLMQTFHLESDPDGEAEVVIRQAREGENIERAELFAKTQRIYDDSIIGEIKLQTEYNQRKLRRKEAWLTLANFNGIYHEDEKGNRVEWFRSGETADGPSLRAAMSESEFNARWNALPPAMAAEISKRVLEVNPTWDPERVGESISG